MTDGNRLHKCFDQVANQLLHDSYNYSPLNFVSGWCEGIVTTNKS